MSETSHLLSKQNSQQPKRFRGGEKKVMKKSLSLLVAIAMVFSMFATLVSAAEKQTAGEYLNSVGVIKGNVSGDLLGDQDWKRQDIAVIISRLLGQEADAKATAKDHEYTDVRGTFYDGYLTWAAEKGLMEGNTNGTFGFDAPITYKEFAAVVLRALGVDTTGENYANVETLAVESGLLPEDTDFSANAVRDVTYNVIVKALDTKIDGVKLGTKLNLPGYEITDLELLSASAVVKSSVVLEFNTEVKTLANEDVTIVDANNGAILVEKVTLSADKATVVLSDELESGVTYTVTVANAASAEGNVLESAEATFKFVKTEPVSIAFAGTTVKAGDKVAVLIKDENGNDITANYSVDDYTVETSDVNIVDENLNASLLTSDVSASAIVNVKLDETDLETANAIITVKKALSASINEVAFVKNAAQQDYTDNNLTKDDLTVTVDETGHIDFNAVDQDDSTSTVTDVSFKSLNASRVIVDASTGEYTANQTGTATVQVSAKIGGVAVTKNVIVTVQAKAKFTNVEFSKTSLRVVEGAISKGVEYTTEIKLVDQYGEVYVPTLVDDVTTTISNAKIAQKAETDNVIETDLADGKAIVTFEEQSTNQVKGSTSVKFTIKVDGTTINKSISVSFVAAGTFAGYAAEISSATVDVAGTGTTKHPLTATVNVYAKNTSGDYVELLNSGLSFETASGKDDIITVDPTTGLVTAKKIGTDSVVVSVGTTKVATLKVTVVSSNPVLTSVTQVKSTMTVSTTDILHNALFGSSGLGNALVGYDQNGDKFNVSGTGFYEVLSSDNNVVDASGFHNAGKAQITVKVEGKFFVINVNVR